MKKILLIFAFSPLCFNAQDAELPKRTGMLPAGIEESSGLEIAGKDTYYTHNDGGGDLNLYKIDKYGSMQEFLTIENVDVKDVEDIARDRKGNLYIGDFGNNKCERTKFKILKVELPEDAFGFPMAKEIKFTLPDNASGRHAENDRNFDIEAMFHHNGWLYIFTKDRSEPTKGYTKFYKIPDDEGHYKATYIGKIGTHASRGKGVITAADISPDGQSMVLLAKEGLYYISNFSGDDFHIGMKEFVPFTFKSQKEAIVYSDDCHVLITDELSEKKGGRIYEMDLCTELFKLREEQLKK